MELLRERDLRENIEKQLLDEQRTRVMLQKRLKKEKKSRRKLQEQMEMIDQRNSMMSGERMSTPPDCHSQDMERERSYMEAAERKLQDSQERNSHLYETYMTHGGSPGATRFAYHPLVKSDVQ
ncbi:hypothetical protein Ahia01_000433800 [Argonauta hians]